MCVCECMHVCSMYACVCVCVWGVKCFFSHFDALNYQASARNIKECSKIIVHPYDSGSIFPRLSLFN